tara:strand:+ start:401 stop:751 length:351 start_codon:yes stop_codon:yes gene_type:complete
MKKLFVFITNLLQHLSFGFNRDGIRGIAIELRLVCTGLTYRGEVKVIDTTYAKYKNYKRIGNENLTLIYKSKDGSKAQIHFGEANPNNWMPKFIQMKLRARGDLPKDHIIKGWDDK